MKIAHWGLGILLVMPMGVALGQAQPQDAQAPPPAQTDALAAAAKQAREAKKDAPKPARVWNDDNVPKNDSAISVVGKTGDEADAAAAAAAANAAANAPAGGAAGTPNRATIERNIANAKEKLATIKVDLDLAQRTYTLDSQMYYVKPDYASDLDGAAKLKDEQDVIAAKQQEMDEEQKKIDDMNAELGKLPAPATAPSSDNNTSN
jgi:hypothetical protein